MSISEILQSLCGEIDSLKPLGVSSFAETYRVTLSGGEDMFVKFSRSQPELIEAERDGLRLIRSAQPDHCPEELLSVNDHRGALLAIPFVIQGSWSSEEKHTFGSALAELHRMEREEFGLASDNFIGANPQQNRPHRMWGDFFVECRIKPQLNLGKRKGWVTRDFERTLSQQLESIREYLNSLGVKPSLCHGDLWSGNALAIQGGGSWFIDPAVYFGDRETDIAFMHYFGGFSPEIFVAYNESYPLADDAKKRFPLYNLYHVMNHANLFGGGYTRSAEVIVEQELGKLV